MTLDNIVKQYVNEMQFTVKSRTYLYYQNFYNIYVKDQFDMHLKTLTTEQLNQKFAKLLETYSVSTLRSLKSLIQRSQEYARKKKYMEEVVPVSLKLGHTKSQKSKCLTKTEQEKLETYILQNNKIYHYGVLVSMYTGLRVGEIVALKWSDIDFKNNIIKVSRTTCKIAQNHKVIDIEDTPKTFSSIREIPVTGTLRKILIELKNIQKDKCQYVITNRFNKKVDMRTYQASFERLLAKLGIKHYGFHSLRHTFATRLLENRVDIKTISELLGHSNASITLNVYVHTNMDTKRKALQLLTKKTTIY